MPTCFHHADRETGRSCTRCGRPACWECLHDAPVGAHCFECARAERPELAQRLHRAVRGESLLVTKVLIGANVAVFLALLGGGATATGGGTAPLQRDLGLYGPAVASGEWWRLLTSGFVHFGMMHLLFNMWALYQLGLTMEAGIGRLRYTTIYAVSVLAGSCGALLLTSDALTAGASGGVFGLAGAATLGLSQRGVRFWNTGWGPLLLVNLAITLTLPQISVGGHLGGLLGGLIAGWALLNPRWAHVRDAAGFAVAIAVAVAAVAGSMVAMSAEYGTCRAAGQYWSCDR